MSELDRVLNNIAGDALAACTQRVVPFPTPEPDKDPTEQAMHTVCGMARDFEHALRHAESAARLAQLQERLSACIDILVTVEEQTIRLRNALNLPLPESWRPFAKEMK